MKRALYPLVLILALATTVCVGVAQQQSSRVVGMAIATVEPGHMAEYMSVVENRIMPLMAEQGVEVIGVFRNGIGGPSNQLTLMLSYRDMAHLQSSGQNSTLTEIQAQTFDAIRVLEQRTLTPVSFSPLQ